MARKKRSPGGQPGNQNARTHGFYSKHPLAAELSEAKRAAKVEGLDQELGLARARIKSIVANDPTNHEILFKAMNSLTSLVRQKYTVQNANKRKLSSAVEAVLRDLLSFENTCPAAQLQSRSGEADSLTISESGTDLTI